MSSPAKPARFVSLRVCLFAAGLTAFGAVPHEAARAVPTTDAEGENMDSDLPPPSFHIREYRVIGSRHLPRDQVDYAVYAYLGPDRTAEDVELARAALEQRYHRAGYQTVVVEIPPQDTTTGVIILSVQEMPVGRLTVRGSKYHDIERIKRLAPSLAEGSIPNFRDVEKDVIRLNRRADLRVTP